MSEIVMPIIIIAGVGALLGTLLGIANIYLLVEVDPRIEEVMNTLPGYNCGSCGFPGCAGFAEALVNKEAVVKSCAPCSVEKRVEIINYLKETEKAS